MKRVFFDLDATLFLFLEEYFSAFEYVLVEENVRDVLNDLKQNMNWLYEQIRL